MARRLDDRPALATVLDARVLGARHHQPRRDPGDARPSRATWPARLGDIELQAEAMEWRIAALIALGDLEAARAELAVVYEMASRVGQPFIIHVAEHYRSAIALCDGRLAEAEATAERSFEWGRLLTGRDPSGSLRRADVRHPPRAGPAGRARPGGADPRGWRPRRRRVGPGRRGDARRARDGRRGPPRARPGAPARARRAARRPVAGRRSPTSPMPATLVGDARHGRRRSTPSSRRTPAASSRSATAWPATARPTATWASVAAAGGERDLARAHLEVALAVDRGMGAWTWLAHTAVPPRPAAALAWPTATIATAADELLRQADDARGADRDADAARPDRGAGRPMRPPGDRRRTGSRRASCRSCGSSPRACRTARSAASSSSSSTPRPTTSAASCARPACANRTEAAAYAHRRGLRATRARGSIPACRSI